MNNLLTTILLACFLFSCNSHLQIEKRKYRKGYHVQLGRSKPVEQQKKKPLTEQLKTVANSVSKEVGPQQPTLLASTEKQVITIKEHINYRHLVYQPMEQLRKPDHPHLKRFMKTKLETKSGSDTGVKIILTIFAALVFLALLSAVIGIGYLTLLIIAEGLGGDGIVPVVILLSILFIGGLVGVIALLRKMLKAIWRPWVSDSNQEKGIRQLPPFSTGALKFGALAAIAVFITAFAYGVMDINMSVGLLVFSGGIVFVAAIAAIVLGIKSLLKYREEKEKYYGSGTAKLGLIMGTLAIAVPLIILLLIVLF